MYLVVGHFKFKQDDYERAVELMNNIVKIGQQEIGFVSMLSIPIRIHLAAISCLNSGIQKNYMISISKAMKCRP